MNNLKTVALPQQWTVLTFLVTVNGLFYETKLLNIQLRPISGFDAMETQQCFKIRTFTEDLNGMWALLALLPIPNCPEDVSHLLELLHGFW